MLFIDCSFSRCNLSLAVLTGTCCRDIVFKECKLWGLHFEHADPFGFSVVFDRTILEKADFRRAVNYSIDPTTNKIKKARFSLDGLAGLLDKYHIEIV